MREGELTYNDFLSRLNIQDVLIDAGYHLNRRDGLRYPSYVRLDSDGRRIRNDKFIVTQQGKCCFKPQHQKSYNIISFIKEHPHFFAEYHAGISPDRLVNLVCNRLLNHPIAERETRIVRPKKDIKPFNIEDYDIHKFNPQDRATQKKFYPFFKHRGIDLYTQYAFHRDFCLATKHRADSTQYTNLSFHMTLPQGDGTVVGFEERGRQRMDGSGSYKGKAEGSNSVDRQPCPDTSFGSQAYLLVRERLRRNGLLPTSSGPEQGFAQSGIRIYRWQPDGRTDARCAFCHSSCPAAHLLRYRPCGNGFYQKTDG